LLVVLIVKILVFEYITGGGFNKQALPDSLVREGRLMLQALLDNLSVLEGVEPVVMLDERLIDTIDTSGMAAIAIRPEQETMQEFARLVAQCDAAWPVAPEFDGILQALCQAVEQSGRALLTSPAGAVSLTGNKLRTYEQLRRHDITTVATRLFDEVDYCAGEWMVKPIDGVGCGESYLITGSEDFAAFSLQARDKARFIFQPHVQGEKTSLSCLFKQGRAWLICVNLQRFEIVDNQYRLTECVVNHQAGTGPYLKLAADIARAFPDLWGYAGIDLIETAERIHVLEINPRLTTSFAGIGQGLGINVAEQVLRLLGGEPQLHPVRNQAITIKVRESDAA
jgi:predicted ATP-grasp superfamily ATP-dependent carboligase